MDAEYIVICSIIEIGAMVVAYLVFGRSEKCIYRIEREVLISHLQSDIERLKAELAEARQMNEDFLSGHFCPNPQLSKLASTCDCAHSDRHRKMDWETIDGLTKVLEKIAKNKDATEYYDELITGGFTQMPDIAKHLVNQIGREADDALQRKKPESRRPNGTIVSG